MPCRESVQFPSMTGSCGGCGHCMEERQVTGGARLWQRAFAHRYRDSHCLAGSVILHRPVRDAKTVTGDLAGGMLLFICSRPVRRGAVPGIFAKLPVWPAVSQTDLLSDWRRHVCRKPFAVLSAGKRISSNISGSAWYYIYFAPCFLLYWRKTEQSADPNCNSLFTGFSANDLVIVKFNEI